MRAPADYLTTFPAQERALEGKGTPRVRRLFLVRVAEHVAARRPRLPLAAAIPATDVLALAGAVILVGHVDFLHVGYVVVTMLSLCAFGSYAPRINPRLADDVAQILGRIAVPLVALAPFAGESAALRPFLLLGPASAGLVLLGRASAYSLIRMARARGLVVEPTLIVGAGEVGVRVANTLTERPEYGLLPIGFLDSFDDQGLPLPILGDFKRLEPIIREYAVQRVIVAFGATREPEMVEVLRACDRLPVEVHLIPRFFELGVAPEGPLTDDLWGIPLVRLRRSALRTVAWATKRSFDLAISTVGLVLTSPVLLISALAVRLSSPGPILFRQQRIGQHGEVFECFKFRTMRMNDDSDTKWSVTEDDRVTLVGRFLRKTSVDELPQLLNIVRGQMSLVGPRPERPHFVDQFSAEINRYPDRHRVPVGLTGWAQVHGLRGDTSIPDRIRFDNYYIEHWSLWRDIVILLRTVRSVFQGG